MRDKVFFVDPQSYNNLAVYDYSLLVNNSFFDITFYGNSYYAYKKDAKINFVSLYAYSGYKNKLKKILSYLYSSIRLMTIVLIVRPKLLHIQWIKVWFIDYYLLLFIKFWLNIKVIYTAHNVLPHESADREVKRFRKYYHLVDSIITHTQRSKSELIEMFDLSSDKISVIPHGLLNYALNDDLVSEYVIKIKEKYLLDHKLVFSVLGKQSYYKGSDIIADVWAKTPLLHDSSKYRLLILGKNNSIDFSELEGIDNIYIENRYISDEEFKAVLRVSDVLVMPYRTISQSGVLLSAINESVPVLVSDVGGLTEPLNIGDIGWDMGEGTFENLQNIMLDIVGRYNQIYHKEHNKKEWDKVKSWYAWDAISNKTFDLYKSLLR